MYDELVDAIEHIFSSAKACNMDADTICLALEILLAQVEINNQTETQKQSKTDRNTETE